VSGKARYDSALRAFKWIAADIALWAEAIRIAGVQEQ
jgi:hypothetical protein